MSLEQKLEALAPIPTDLKPLLLPNAAATIQHLISFPTPSFEQPPAIITGTQITLSKEPSTLFHDRTDLLRLQQLPLLAYSDLQKLAQAALESSPDVASFTYPLEQALSEHVGPHDAWPLWVLVYWLHVYQVLNAKGHWALLLAKVAAVGGDSAVIERLPWNVPLPSDNQAGRGSLGHVMSLLAFGTREWLNSTHMDLLLYSLEFTINDPDILVLNTWMFDILWSLHNIDPTSYPSQAHAALTTMGTRIRTAKQILLVVPVCIGDGKAVVGGLGIMSNHWISAVIDPKLQEVRHYDPMSIRPPDGLLALINWWLGMHGEPPYTHDSIPCTLQRDSYSCGLLCVNALAHDALPARFPLLDSHGCDQGRIQMLEQIIQYLGHLDAVTFPPASATSTASQEMENGITDTAQATPAVKTKKPNPPAKPKSPAKKPAAKRKPRVKREPKVKFTSKSKLDITFAKFKVEGTTSNAAAKRTWDTMMSSEENIATGTDLEAKATVLASDMHASPLPSSADTIAASAGVNGGDERDDGDLWVDLDEDAPYSRGELVDIDTAKTSTRRGGKPANALLNELTRKCFLSSDESKKTRHRCVGSPEKWCGTSYANRNSKRWFKHAMSCSKLPAAARAKAAKECATWAPSRIAQLAAENAARAQAKEDDAPAAKSSKTASGQTATSDSRNTSKLHTMATSTARVARHAALDEGIMLLFVMGGLALRLVDLLYFKNVLYLADRTYKPPSREKLEYEFIQGEAAAVLQRQIDILKEKEHLTISWDGGTANNNKRQAFYTCNITTEDGATYLMETREATDESHTGDWIRNFVIEVIDRVGRDNFSGGVCDSTGNTRVSRRLVEGDVPTILALADVCHHLSNTSKDIAKLPYFADVIQGVRAIISKFHRSHPAIHALARERENFKISRGLESIGKTRFLTTYRAAMSVERCAKPIEFIVQSDEIECEEFADYFQGPHDPLTFTFHKILSDLTCVGSPLLKALTCLEAVEADAGHVYILWHAALQAIGEVVDDRKRSIPRETQDCIKGILNHRHNQLFAEGGTLASPIYLTCAYLNPEYLKNGLFTDEDRAQYTDDNFTGIRFPHLFEKVFKFLLNIASKEIVDGARPQFICWKGRSTEYKTALVSELRMYSRAQYPYNTPLVKDQSMKLWWKGINELPNAVVLPALAVKLYSIRINSMPEERSVSTFTWLTPSVRNRIDINTVHAMTTIRQFHLTQKKLKERKTTAARPNIRYYDIKKTHKEKPATDEDSATEECEVTDEDAGDLDTIAGASALDVSCSGANLSSPYITQVLADEPSVASVPLKRAARTQHNASGYAPVSTPTAADNDFGFDPTDLLK